MRRASGGYSDRFRAYRVLIDGREAGKLRRGQDLVVEVEPGTHEVHATIDWARSPTVSVTLGGGEEASLVCAPKANPLTALYYISLGRDRYIDLRPG